LVRCGDAARGDNGSDLKWWWRQLSSATPPLSVTEGMGIIVTIEIRHKEVFVTKKKPDHRKHNGL